MTTNGDQYSCTIKPEIPPGKKIHTFNIEYTPTETGLFWGTFTIENNFGKEINLLFIMVTVMEHPFVFSHSLLHFGLLGTATNPHRIALKIENRGLEPIPIKDILIPKTQIFCDFQLETDFNFTAHPKKITKIGYAIFYSDIPVMQYFIFRENTKAFFT